MTNEQLREAVARAICHDNVNGGCPCQHGFKCLSSLWDTAADAAIAIVLEEAAKVADFMGKQDEGTDGHGVAYEVAAAIRAMKDTP